MTNELKQRIDNMATWAAGVEEKLDQLQKALAPSDSDGDIVHDMMNLEQLQASMSSNLGELLTERANIMADLADAKEEMDEIEAEASLSVDGKNVSERQARLTVKLKENDRYKELKEFVLINERALLVKKAHIENQEREYKRLGGRIRNLRARLENLTARYRANIGETT